MDLIHLLQILVLAIVQGAAELLPVSSSAHVTIVARLMGYDMSRIFEWTFLLMVRLPAYTGPVAAGHRAELQVLFDADAQKRAAPLGDMGNPPAHDILGRPTGNALAAKADLAALPHHATKRTQHRRLAGAIGAQEGAHPPLVEIETNPKQSLLLAVKGVEMLDLEHHRRGSEPR